MNGHVKDNSGSGIGYSDTEPQDTEQTVEHSASTNPHEQGTSNQVAAVSRYTRGSNLLDQTPTKENAQSLFPQTFCIYVGNLSSKLSTHILERDLQELMLSFGRCHVNIRFSHIKNMPSGFVQYEERATAERAFEQGDNLWLHHRQLRLEWSRAHTTAVLCLRSGRDITESETRKLLAPIGKLNTVNLRTHHHPLEHTSVYAIVEFDLHGHYAKALQIFHHNKEYYLCGTEMEVSHQDGPGEGNISNQPPQNRNWNNQRYRKPYRAWNNGNGYNNGTMGNGGNGGNGRGGFRNGPRHPGSFSSQHTPTQSFNAQNNPSHGLPPCDYNGGNNFPPGFGGAGNFNQGYNPTVNPNFPQGNPGNVPQHFSPGYPPVGGFANQSVFFNQMPVPEGPTFHPEYPGIPNPGHPMFMTSPYAPASLPPMMVQPRSLVETLTQRRPPGPNEPFIVSSQPQYDTDRHRQLYYCDPNQEFAGMQPNWFGASGGYYMQPDYSQYSPVPDPRSRQSSLEAPYPEGSPRAEAFDSSALTQIHVGPTEGETAERGRQLVREHHSNTDGGSDMPPVTVSAQARSDPLPVQINVQEGAILTESGVEPTNSQKEPIEPENNPNEHQSEPTKAEPAEPEPTASTDEPSHAPAVDEEHKESSGETACELEVETKSVGSAETSDGAPGLKTPDTDQSQELANTSTASQTDSQATVVAQIASESKSPSTTVTPEAANTDKLDKGKSPARNQSPVKGKSPVKDQSPAKGKSPAKHQSLAKCHARFELATGDAPKTPARDSLHEHKPLKAKYQPKTDTGKTVADYTRERYSQMVENDPSFEFEDASVLEEAIRELEGERRQKMRAEDGLAPDDESPGSGSPKSPKAPKAKSVA